MNPFLTIQGTIEEIRPFPSSSSDNSSCDLIIIVYQENGEEVHLVVSQDTYILNAVMLRPGDLITAFYNSNAPVPLIFPPQFRAVAIASRPSYETVVLDYFDSDLMNSGGTLRLSPSAETIVVTANGQWYPENPGNHFLMAVYTMSTRSIPAITVPVQIIVFCS